MNKCLNCNADLVQIEGKREKKFCNSTCRSNYWQKQKVVEKALSKSFKENRVEINKTVNDILEGGVAITHSDTNGTITRIDPLSEEGQKVQELARNEKRIKELEAELNNPPKTAMIGVKNWIMTRQIELAKLKSTTKN